MTRNQALEFLQFYNIVAPDMRQRDAFALAKTDVMRLIEQVANGAIVCEIKPVTPAAQTT